MSDTLTSLVTDVSAESTPTKSKDALQVLSLACSEGLLNYDMAQRFLGRRRECDTLCGGLQEPPSGKEPAAVQSTRDLLQVVTSILHEHGGALPALHDAAADIFWEGGRKSSTAAPRPAGSAATLSRKNDLKKFVIGVYYYSSAHQCKVLCSPRATTQRKPRYHSQGVFGKKPPCELTYFVSAGV